MDILADLNPAQREAVEAVSGPVLILAGPGSGKTRVITHRVAYLIKVCGVSPRHIMAVTFTNKAAREMKERLQSLVGAVTGELTLGTFHAICARVLRREGGAIDIDPHFVIYDADDQLSVIKRAFQELGLDTKQYAPAAVASGISAAKSQLLTPGDYHQRGHSYFQEIVSRVYERYQQLLAESHALDFDDLLMKTVQLFRKNPEILSRYQTRYRHLLVDEFQDTNLVQYELIKQLGDKYRNICVVGDPDQSIYSWRFADLRNILSFEKDYPETKLVLLEENYRSTKLILETASNIISANRQRKEKNLWTKNEPGEPATVVETYTEQEEAQYVVREIDRLVGGREFRHGDCAVMYRTNAQSRALEEAFLRYGMPYRLVAGTRFYERREVKDIIAYLRLILNPDDSVSLLRTINIPARGIGQQSQDRLSGWARSLGVSPYQALQLIATDGAAEVASQPHFAPQIKRALTDFAVMMGELIQNSRKLKLDSLFVQVLERTGYQQYLLGTTDGEERWENVTELLTVAQAYGDLKPVEGLEAFLEGVALVSDVDGLDTGADAVTLITLHQAKGLEFPVVFIVGMEEGILPHYKSLDDPSQMEEERRLCYVGVTRAKRMIYLVRSFRRNLMGRSMVCEPSRFLKDIPGRLVSSDNRWEGGEEPLSRGLSAWDRAPVAVPGSGVELKAGDHVRHAQFGEGVVVSCKAVKGDREAVVAFGGLGVKRLLLSFAPLEKVA